MGYPHGMSMTFRDALLAAVKRTKTPVKRIAAETGVSYEQLKKVLQRETATTNVDDAVKIARFFGMTVNEFLGDDLVSDRAEVALLYSRLSERERQILLAAAPGLRALPQEGDEK